MDSLPLEIVLLIARDSSPIFNALSRALPLLGRATMQTDYRRLFRIDTHTGTKLRAFGKICWHSFGDIPKIKRGSKYWHHCGKLHRDNDLPAVDYKDGGKRWYKYGKPHRDDGKPAAVIGITKEWWVNGLRHRDNDRPAVIGNKNGQLIVQWYTNGRIHRDNDLPASIVTGYDRGREWIAHTWFRNGKAHRDNDLPAIIKSTGDKIWYNHGKIHRDSDQPAIIMSSGERIWYKHGIIHRENGPAYEDGDKKIWYIDGHEQVDPTYTLITNMYLTVAILVVTILYVMFLYDRAK